MQNQRTGMVATYIVWDKNHFNEDFVSSKGPFDATKRILKNLKISSMWPKLHLFLANFENA